MKRKNRIALCGILAVMMAFVMAMPVSANTEISEKYVASIGDKGYATLQEAFNAVQDGETIELLEDIEVNEGSNGVRYDGDADFTVDFKGFTFTSNTSNSAFVIVSDKSIDVTLKNGTITAGSSAYCTVITGGDDGADVVVTIKNMTLNNSRSYGNSIKAFNNSTVNVNDTTVISKNGAGGTEAAGGIVNITNCQYDQGGFYDHNSTNMAASGGGTVNVYSGAFTSANYGAYIFNSGGTINIKGGTFDSKKAVLKADTTLTASSPSTIYVSGGDFAGEYSIMDGTELSITGGSFSEDPLDYVDKRLAVAEITKKGSSESTFAVGEKAIDQKTAEAEEGDQIKIISGDADLDVPVDGVKVSNEGGGNVTVNGEPVNETPVESHVHAWGEPVWNWSEDGKTCTVTFTCEKDETHKETPKVTVTSAEKTPGTCTEAGVTTYTATVEFNGKTYTDTKDLADIPATGHSYDNGKCTVCGAIASDFKVIITAGANGSWQKGTKDGLTFTSNAAYKYFQKVQVDGKDLDVSNYTVKEGSTIVTLKAEYLETLSVGKHTLSIVSDTGTATTEFTIKAAAVTDDTQSPQTGDDSNIALWIAVLLAAGTALTGTAVYSRKRKYSK